VRAPYLRYARAIIGTFPASKYIYRANTRIYCAIYAPTRVRARIYGHAGIYFGQNDKFSPTRTREQAGRKYFVQIVTSIFRAMIPART
jgi:hypothetical protein